MDDVQRLRLFLELIERDGDLHLAHKPGEKLAPVYEQLKGMGLIESTARNAPGFWKLTANDRQALEAARLDPQTPTAALPQKGGPKTSVE